MWLGCSDGSRSAGSLISTISKCRVFLNASYNDLLYMRIPSLRLTILHHGCCGVITVGVLTAFQGTSKVSSGFVLVCILSNFAQEINRRLLPFTEATSWSHLEQLNHALRLKVLASDRLCRGQTPLFKMGTQKHEASEWNYLEWKAFPLHVI